MQIWLNENLDNSDLSNCAMDCSGRFQSAVWVLTGRTWDQLRSRHWPERNIGFAA